MEQTAELDRLRRGRERAEERAKQLTAQAEELRVQLAETEAKIAERDDDLRRLRSQHDSLRSLTAVRAERIRELEQQCGLQERSLREVEEAKAALEARVTVLEKDHAAQTEAMTVLEKERDEAVTASRPPPPPDDLRKIYGIGPKYEKLLHEAGVVSYAQIAAWTEEDLAAIAKALKMPSARITKAGWIDSARELLGEEPAPPTVQDAAAAEDVAAIVDEPSDLSW